MKSPSQVLLDDSASLLMSVIRAARFFFQLFLRFLREVSVFLNDPATANTFFVVRSNKLPQVAETFKECSNEAGGVTGRVAG